MKKILFLIIIISATTKVFSQKKQNGGGISDQSQTVIKDFEATLLESERIKGTLSLPRLDTSVKAQSYNLSARNFKVDYLPPKIRPIGMGGDKKGKNDDVKNGYVKAGYGIPHSPYAEASYAFGNKNLDATLALKHHSMNNKNVAFQKFSETGGSFTGSYHLNEKYAIGGKLGYNKNNIWLYGAADSSTLENNIKQGFNKFNIGLSAFSTARNDADMTYSAAVNFSRLADNFAAKESNADVSLQATKWFAEKHPLALGIRTDFSKFDFLGANRKETLNNIYLTPSFTFHADAFKIKAGLNLISNNDEWYPLPDIEATVRVLGDRLAVFGGWKGDVQKNTFHTLTNYNPYMSSQLQSNFDFGKRMLNTRFQDYFGGVKGHWGAVDYNVQGGYKPTTNLALFNPNQSFFLVNTKESGRFDVLYGDVNITYLKGSLGAKVKNFEIGGFVSQNIYTMKSTTIQKAWHLPATQINGTVAYKLLEEKLKVKGQVFFENGVPYLTSAGTSDKLGTLIDISAGLEYSISNNFGVFLDVNNLLNQKRERWFNYPSYGLNVLGGVTAKF